MRPILGLPPDRHRLRLPADGTDAAFSPRENIQQISSLARLDNEDSWRALSQEQNPAAFWQGVLSLTESLERGGDETTALALYQYAAEILSAEEGLAALHRRFSSHRDAILGRGELSGTRMDHLGRRFIQQATDPAMIGSFLIAGGANQLVRAFSAASLAMRAGPAFWTSGMGAQALAGTLAFAVEVPAFVGASRGLSQIFSDAHQPMESVPLGDALFSATLFLGAIKTFGFFTHHAFRMTPGLERFAGGGRIAGSVSGIYLGQRLEEGFGLRPSRDEADRWIDVGDTWLQLTVGGRIAASLIGPVGANLVFARVGSGRTQSSPLREPASPLAFMRARLAASFEEFDESETQPNFRLSAPPLERLMLRFGHSLSQQARFDIQQIGRLTSDADRFYILLERIPLREGPRLEAAIGRLRAMFSYSRSGGLRGNYPSWITRLAVERLMETGDSVRMLSLMNALYGGGTLAGFEGFLGEILPEAALDRGPKVGRLRTLSWFLGGNRAFHNQVRTMPLSPEARGALHRFVARDPKNVNLGLDALARYLRDYPERRETIQGILAHALQSPLGELRVHRLLQILISQPELYPKIGELADVEVVLPAWENRARYPVALEQIRNSWADAYLDDPTFADYLSSFYLHLPRYLEPLQAKINWERTQLTLQTVVREAKPITESDVLRALRALGDRNSLRVLESLLSGETALRIEEDAPFLERARRINPDVKAEHLQGFCLCTRQGMERDTFFLRQIRNVSSTPFHRVFFLRLATLIHEHEHHVNPQELPGTNLSGLREEVSAHLKAIHWRAEHGDIAEASERTAHPLGFAHSLRDRVEWTDLRHADDPDL